MAKAVKVNYDSVGETLSIFFSDQYRVVVGVADAPEYEIFVDDDLRELGEEKIVGIDIIHMDLFDPDKVKELTDEQRQVVKDVFQKYAGEMSATA